MNPYAALGLQLPQVPGAVDEQEQIRQLIAQQLQSPAPLADPSTLTPDMTKDLAQAQAAHEDATGRQYAFGNLGILSGDSVLSKFGQAQLSDIKAFNPMQFRGQALLQAQQRLKLQRDTENRKAQHATTSDAIKHLLSLQGLSAQQRSQLIQIAALNQHTQDKNQDQETGLRKELLEHPITKDYNKAQVAYQGLQAAAADPSPQGDIALVYGAMHVYDPNSVVRETEFATAENAGSVPERLRARWNKLVSGQRLTSTERADILKTAKGQFGVKEQAYNNLRTHYAGLATATGATPSHVTLDGIDTMPAVKEPTLEEIDKLGKNPAPLPGQPDVDLTEPPAPRTAASILIKKDPAAPARKTAAEVLLKRPPEVISTPAAVAPPEEDGPVLSPAEAAAAIAAARARKGIKQAKVTESKFTPYDEADQPLGTPKEQAAAIARARANKAAVGEAKPGESETMAQAWTRLRPQSVPLEQIRKIDIRKLAKMKPGELLNSLADGELVRVYGDRVWQRQGNKVVHLLMAPGDSV